jgi:hypothetical protein
MKGEEEMIFRVRVFLNLLSFVFCLPNVLKSL